MAELLAIGGGQNDSAWDELYREYLENRTLILNNEIDESVIEDYVMYILKWNKDDMHLPVESRTPIKFLISSPGGNVFDANILIDVIESSKTPVVGVGLDLVASAAYLIYLACHTRVSFKNTSYLQHEGMLSIENSRSKVKDNVEFFDQQELRAKEYVLSKTNMTEEFYDNVYNQELWMYADKAKEFGIVDKIIGVDCDLDEIL